MSSQAVQEALETADELVRAAGDAGFEVTADQLARWHRAGLLRYVKPKGRGRGRGTQSLYAPGSRAQVVAVCRIVATDRNLDRAALGMWWEGWSVSTERVRPQIADIAAECDATLNELRRTLVEAPDKLSAAVNDPKQVRSLPRVLRRSRKRVGSANFETFAMLLAGLGTGRIRSISPSEAALLESGMNVEHGRKDGIGGVGPWLTGDPEEAILSICRAIATVDLGALVASLSDRELEALRDDYREVFHVIHSSADFFVTIFGINRFGFDGIRPMFATATTAEYVQLTLFFCALARKNPEKQQGILEFKQLAPTAARMDGSLAFLDALRKGIPELGQKLNTRDFEEALRWTVKTGSVPGWIPEEARKYHDEIKALLEQHPELRPAEEEKAPA